MSIHIPPALHHRRFTLLWIGLLISVTGSQMQLWALFWHVRQLTDQPIAVSIIGAVRFFPILLLALFGGLMADRYNRRKIMFLTQSSSIAIALALGLLTYSGQIQLWHIYTLTAIQAAAMAFDLPARQALVPNLVPGKDLPSAFSLQSIAFNTGSIVGPALSGIVIGYLGQEYTYLINAVTFLGVLMALVLMGPIQQRARTSHGLNQVFPEIRDAIRFILRQKIILSSMVLDFLATFFSSANTLLPYVAQDILKVGPLQYGWLASAQSVGALGAGLVISQARDLRRQGRLLLGSVTIFGLATIFFGTAYTFGLAPLFNEKIFLLGRTLDLTGVSLAYVMTFLALILVGVGDSVSTILRNTIRQLQTPDDMRGRMTGINQIFFQGGPQLGEIEAGAVAQIFSVPTAIITGGIGCILTVVFINHKWPVLRSYNGDETILAGASMTAD